MGPQRFRPVDEVAAAMSAWDLELRPLSPGGAGVWMHADASAALHWVKFHGRVHQLGAPPAERYTIGMVIPSDYALRWNGRLVSEDQIEIFAPGQEYESCGPEDFGAFTVSVDRTRWDRMADQFRVPTLRVTTNDKPWVARPRRPESLRQIKRTIAHLIAGQGHNAALDDVLASLLLMLQRSVSSTASAPRRRRVFLRAMEFLEGLPRGDNPSISSICEAVNCSLSTLERAFREHVGIGPKAYVIACRLHGVRRELLAADKPQRVGDVAIRWGFWHMGKFASDYCRAFGELPSATLNAPRTRGG